MRVVLTFETGAFAGRTILLQSGQWITVGRTERADYSVPHDDLMSSRHFRIECQNQFCRVRDLDSTNGTRVNDGRIVETDLNHGDRLFAGRTTLIVSIEQAEPVIRPATVDGSPTATSSAQEANELAAPQPPALDQLSTETTGSIAARSTSSVSAWLSGIDSNLPFAQGLLDPDADVRREALRVAARARKKWLLEFCRRQAEAPAPENWDALHLLAILGHPSDLTRVLAIGRAQQLGPRRFEILAAYGHPGVVRDLIVAMENPDPATAAVAVESFAKITGFTATVEPAPAAPPPNTESVEEDETEEEAPQDVAAPIAEAESDDEELALPDAKSAEQYWQKMRDQFAKGVRWRRGVEISRRLEGRELESLDLECRYELQVRCCYEGRELLIQSADGR